MLECRRIRACADSVRLRYRPVMRSDFRPVSVRSGHLVWLVLLCLSLLGVRLLPALLPLPQPAVAERHDSAPMPCAEVHLQGCAEAEPHGCCAERPTSCLLDCAQMTPGLPSRLSDLGLALVRVLPPPASQSLPDPLPDPPFQPPRPRAMA